MPETTFADRIRELIRREASDNASAFAKAIGSKSGVVAAFTGGRMNEPRMETLRSILNAYPRISPDWLVSGNGAMYRATAGIASEVADPAPTIGRPPGGVIAITVDRAGNDNIAMVGTRARGAYAQEMVLEPELMRDLPVFSLPGREFRNGTFRAFEVAGDSMEGVLLAGDIVIARRLDVWSQEIANGDVHVVVTLDDVLVKYVLNQLDSTGSLALQSENAAYGVQAVEGDEVREVWRAVGRLSTRFVSARYTREMATALRTTDAQVAELLLEVERLKKK